MILPDKLANPPLVEVIFEVRFRPAMEGLSDLLPGMIYQTLGAEYPDLRPLPLASVPRELRVNDANMKYLASHLLVGSGGHLFIGDATVGIGKPAPYQGWDEMRGRIERLLKVLQEKPIKDMVAFVERYSLKASNLIAGDTGKQLSKLQVNLALGGQPVPETGFQLRTEFVQDSRVTILEIACNTEVKTPTSRPKSGLLVRIDCIQQSVPNGQLKNVLPGVDALHTAIKERFFSLLSSDTLQGFSPAYQGVK